MPAVKQSAKSKNLANRSTLSVVLPVLLGVIIASFVLEFSYGGKNTKFEEMALGEGTSSLFCEYDGYPIHCQGVEDSGPCIQGWNIRGKNPVVLWLGNSQVHAVNQLKQGQENAPPILFRRLYKKDIDLLTFSQPNVSLQEHYVLFEYLRIRLPVKTLILPLVFDDLRETGIRSDIALALEDARVVSSLATTEIGRQILQQATQNKEDSSVDSSGDDLKGIRNTIQEHSESALNKWLSDHSTLWKIRPEARGNLLGNLYLLRNSIFGITAQSKRKMIKLRYHANIRALTAILDSAAQSGIGVLVYIVPIRDDIEIPYVKKEYEIFKQKAENLAKEKNAVFCNLESLVPATLWGAKESTSFGKHELEADFMHFQAPGHMLLAKNLAQILETRFLVNQP